MSKTIVVFDLDDTLYKEIDFLISGFRFISFELEKRYNIPNAFQELYTLYREGKNTFKEIDRKYELNIPVTDYLLWYRNHFPAIRLQEEVDQTLSWMASRTDIVIGLITDGREVTQNNKIEALGLLRFIDKDNIVISEKFGSGKPDKRNYLFFEQKFGANHTYWYVGDNLKKDFLAPNHLGWRSVLLLDDGRNIHRQDFQLPAKHLPEFTITALEEIKNLLQLPHTH